MQMRVIERKKVSDEVFEQMKDMISNQVWKEGEKIPSQNELQEIFKVSRVSIREALKKLESSGIIITYQGRGSFVKKFEDADLFGESTLEIYRNSVDSKTIRDFMEFRRIIEIESAELAAERATQKDIGKLEVNYQSMINSREDIQKFSDYDFEFHEIIAHITGNTILIRCFGVILTFLKKDFDAVVEKVGVSKGSYYHREILNAIRNHQPQMAKALMAEHLQVTSTIFFDTNGN